MNPPADGEQPAHSRPRRFTHSPVHFGLHVAFTVVAVVLVALGLAEPNWVQVALGSAMVALGAGQVALDPRAREEVVAPLAPGSNFDSNCWRSRCANGAILSRVTRSSDSQKTVVYCSCG